jgi:hypothetical protein
MLAATKQSKLGGVRLEAVCQLADRAGHGVGQEAALYGWVADALMADATTSDHARRLITAAREWRRMP